MGTWAGKFSRFEIHFGYPHDPIQWLHMGRLDLSRSLLAAKSVAESKSKELKIFVRIYDAKVEKCVGMFRDGEAIEFTPEGHPK